MRCSWVSLLIALAAFLLAARHINHGLVNSSMRPGPGLTTDEGFNIYQGVYLLTAASQHGPLVFTPAGAKSVFGTQEYLADHPPLGRLLLGFAHQSFHFLISGNDSCRLNVPAARLGSCLALAATVFLLVEFSARQFGLLTAILSGLILMTMPQVIGHSRLATLETATMLAWWAATLPLLAWWTRTNPPTTRQSAITGILWGLLMLTKMQGILLPPLIVAWSFGRFRMAALRPLIICAVAGCAIFFFSWPWLWLDPLPNLRTYLGRASDRIPLYVWYFGQRFADKAVPWHYPVVMTAITVPAFALVAFFSRLVLRRLTVTEFLVLASVAWPVILFSLPGIPVYDGIRLFLCIMPGFALLAARGIVLLIFRDTPGTRNRIPSFSAAGSQGNNSTVSSHSAIPPAVSETASAAGGSRTPRTVITRTSSLVTAVLIFFLMGRMLLSGVLVSPFAISTYNELAGGTSGAAALGMESSYWGDGLNGRFWQQVPENSTLFVAPVMHQYQLNDLQTLVPEAVARRIRLKPFMYDPLKEKGLLLLIHRLADLRPSLRTVPEGAGTIVEVTAEGVVLARLIDTTDATWITTP